MFNENTLSVLTRPIPKDKIKQRPGKGGMQFSYISADLVIDTLNEAFGYNWSQVVFHNEVKDDVVIVGLELSIFPAPNSPPIRKQQFGSCEITRGLGVGQAYKGATSDALKKCATLLGVGLELYQDEEVDANTPRFSPPAAAPARQNTNVPRPPAPVAAPPAGVPAPPAPASFGPPATPVAAPPAPSAFTPPAPVPAPAPAVAPPAPTAFQQPATPVAPPAVQAPAAPRPNPFTRNTTQGAGPNSTQINSLINIANRKGVSPAQLIAEAGITDPNGNPLGAFEDLSYDQAIQVIKVAR